MASDSDYDDFDYRSSQATFDIDEQIERFEARHSIKTALVKVHCANDQPTPKAARKSFRYDRYPRPKRGFQCDEEFAIKAKTDEDEHPEHFSAFRRHFYQKKHQAIKSSFDCMSNLSIIDIRLAAINESVQNDFMQRLQRKSSSPAQLVYHGTSLSNIESILRYGFLVPGQAHPSNPAAPIISSKHGQAFGRGIYCSQTANYALGYMTSTNTLLACAAIPQRDRSGLVTRCHGNIMVLSHVAQIIPLFLVDFKYLVSSPNHPHFDKPKQVENNEEEDHARKPVSVSRKDLRKTLCYINDHGRRSDRYQSRLFDLSQ